MKYRLLPDDRATALRLVSLWDACRYVRNDFKEAREIQYSHACGRRVESPTFFTLGKAFKTLWDFEPWLHDHSYTVLRYTLKYQADPWKAFFRGTRGYPKWKSRHVTISFTIPNGSVRVADDRLAVPKVGWLSLRRRGGNPYPDGRPVRAVVRREGKRWFATVCYKVNQEHTVHNGHAIGVDRNVGQVADSNGENNRMPDRDLLEIKVKRHQRKLSRRKKGSRRRAGQRRKLTRAQRRLANARKDWQHKVSRLLADKAGTVVVEKLNTRGMTRSSRGTAAASGTNARAKSGLNRVILSTGWAGMEHMLEYKALELIRVPAAHTSQTCSACGVVDADSRRTQARFKCVACGRVQNADLNAARNSVALGTRASARREAFTLVTPVNRETDTD